MIMRCFALIAALFVAAAPALAEAPGSMASMPKKMKVRYSCGNLRVPVIYDNVKNRASVTYGSRRYLLPRVASADGSRYANAKLEWWSKGDTATLSSVTDGKTDNVLANCTALTKK